MKEKGNLGRRIESTQRKYSDDTGSGGWFAFGEGLVGW